MKTSDYTLTLKEYAAGVHRHSTGGPYPQKECDDPHGEDGFVAVCAEYRECAESMRKEWRLSDEDALFLFKDMVATGRHNKTSTWERLQERRAEGDKSLLLPTGTYEEARQFIIDWIATHRRHYEIKRATP